MTFQHKIQMATEYQQRAMLYFRHANEAEQRGDWRFAEVYERQAETMAQIADEYYVEAECHNWAKRG